MLSEDYNARVEASHHAVLPFSVHKALSTMVRAPADVEAYRRLAAAVGEWNAYCAPTMEPSAHRADDEE